MKWRSFFRTSYLSAFACLTLASAPIRAENVAVTFDDLPTYGARGDIADAQSTTTRLLAGLKRHHIKATGFVNEIQLTGNDREQRIGLLSQWLDAGMELGNHSYSHLSLSKTPVDAYIADVAHGEEVTRPLMARQGGPSAILQQGFADAKRGTGGTLLSPCFFTFRIMA